MIMNSHLGSATKLKNLLSNIWRTTTRFRWLHFSCLSTTDTRSKHNLWGHIGHMSAMPKAFKIIKKQNVGTTSQPSFKLWRCLVPASRITSPFYPRPSRLVIPLARLCPKRCCHLGSITTGPVWCGSSLHGRSRILQHHTPLRPSWVDLISTRVNMLNIWTLVCFLELAKVLQTHRSSRKSWEQ